MPIVKLYTAIARTIQQIDTCRERNNVEWLGKSQDRLQKLIRDHMPSGSGIDSGTTLDESSKRDRLVFNTSFHHMNDGGYYDGWTEHQVIVTPSLSFGIDLRITGRDRNEIKEYLADVFHTALTAEIEEYPEATASAA